MSQYFDNMVQALNQLVWALIGLLLTICATFVEAYFTTSPWSWSQQGIYTYRLGVTYQIGAVLLVGCLGGRNAGALSQIAYLVVGLSGLPVFAHDSGISAIKQPYFGYLLGFVAGAWVCGLLAFKALPKLEYLAFSCICGLFTIHLIGLAYLLILPSLPGAGTEVVSLQQAALSYSLYPLPGQMVVVCAVTVVAYCLRRLLFY